MVFAMEFSSLVNIHSLPLSLSLLVSQTPTGANHYP